MVKIASWWAITVQWCSVETVGAPLPHLHWKIFTDTLRRLLIFFGTYLCYLGFKNALKLSNQHLLAADRPEYLLWGFLPLLGGCRPLADSNALATLKVTNWMIRGLLKACQGENLLSGAIWAWSNPRMALKTMLSLIPGRARAPHKKLLKTAHFRITQKMCPKHEILMKKWLLAGAIAAFKSWPLEPAQVDPTAIAKSHRGGPEGQHIWNRRTARTRNPLYAAP